MPITPQEAIQYFDEDLGNGSGAPHLLMRVTGGTSRQRAQLLTQLAATARSHHWTVITETASPGFTERIARKTGYDQSAPWYPDYAGMALHELFTFTLSRKQLGQGLVILLNNTDQADPKEMIALATTIQQITSEHGNIAFILAQTPRGEQRWLDRKSPISFLRRATAVSLEP